MDGFVDLAAGLLELVLDVVPFRVSAAVVVNLAAVVFAVGWADAHIASPAAPWVIAAAAVLPLATLAFLLWPRERVQPPDAPRQPRACPPAILPARLPDEPACADAEREPWSSSFSSTSSRSTRSSG